MKKGRHRRFEEARALKRTDNVDLDGIFESLDDNGPSGVTDWEDVADEYSQWADVAAEYDAKQATDTAPGPDIGNGAASATDTAVVEAAAVDETSPAEETVPESSAPESVETPEAESA